MLAYHIPSPAKAPALVIRKQALERLSISRPLSRPVRGPTPTDFCTKASTTSQSKLRIDCRPGWHEVATGRRAGTVTGKECFGRVGDRPLSTKLLALLVRKFLERFPAQIFRSGLQVRDADPFGIFQVIQRIQDLVSRVASDVGSAWHSDHESCLWLHISPLCPGHSTLNAGGANVKNNRRT